MAGRNVQGGLTMWVVAKDPTPGRRLHLPGSPKRKSAKPKTWIFATRAEAEAFKDSQSGRLDIYQQSWLPGAEPKEV